MVELMTYEWTRPSLESRTGGSVEECLIHLRFTLLPPRLQAEPRLSGECLAGPQLGAAAIVGSPGQMPRRL